MLYYTIALGIVVAINVLSNIRTVWLMKKLNEAVDIKMTSDYTALRKTMENIRKEEEFLTKKMMLDSIEEAKKELIGNTVKD